MTAMMNGTPVLVVDDCQETRDGIRDLLQCRGYVVAEAADGREALELLERGVTPCLIMLDLSMPVMGGWELLAILNSDCRLSRIPVMLLSGDPLDQAAARRRAFAAYLRKPPRPEILLGAVRSHARFPDATGPPDTSGEDVPQSG
jgi:CheY-like chemotaxis protein